MLDLDAPVEMHHPLDVSTQLTREAADVCVAGGDALAALRSWQIAIASRPEEQRAEAEEQRSAEVMATRCASQALC